MALIKNRHAGGLASRGFQDLGDLGRQAAGIVEAAKVEAARILEEARVEAAEIAAGAAPAGLAEGREQGLREGRDEGVRLGREAVIGEYTATLAALAESWAAALETFEADRGRIVQTAREDVVKLALAIGGKIAHRAVEADPAIVQDQVAEAIALVTAPSGITLSINPADRKLVEAVLAAPCDRLEQGTHVELRDDPDVERGGCVLATGRGVIDATLRKQAERIAETLLPGTPPKRRRKPS